MVTETASKIEAILLLTSTSKKVERVGIGNITCNILGNRLGEVVVRYLITISLRNN